MFNPLKSSLRKLQTKYHKISRSRSKILPFANRLDYKETWTRLVGSKEDAYNYVAGYTDEAEFERTGQHTVDILDQFVGVRPDDIFLEIGCGVGRVGKILSDKCAKWIGTDISPHMLAVAAERLKEKNNVEFVELEEVSLQQIPDSSVDVVYSTVVFMHLLEWDRYRYIAESLRILRPGGRCFFDNVDITSDHGWKVFMDGYQFDINHRPSQLSMVSSGDELETYAKKAGFEKVTIHRWDNAWVGVTGVKPFADDTPVNGFPKVT